MLVEFSALETFMSSEDLKTGLISGTFGDTHLARLHFLTSFCVNSFDVRCIASVHRSHENVILVFLESIRRVLIIEFIILLLGYLNGDLFQTDGIGSVNVGCE